MEEEEDPDPIAHLAAEIEALPEPLIEEIISVASLDNGALSALYNDTKDALLTLGQALRPSTQKGRDLHSVRSACLIEMKKRGLR